ncbi:hypothetical protein RHMOL_Rhmol11G0232700 [Rhododendron molle]|uniref:Uncharacterized protein n=1 Tax=Rhododendron molle TaxID=49168 RepID=A0ACC0LWE3_RHOML|nr:hypothetical protein RHMOL_Rhmol11G0232700 [Rhododendron molle]
MQYRSVAEFNHERQKTIQCFTRPIATISIEAIHEDNSDTGTLPRTPRRTKVHGRGRPGKQNQVRGSCFRGA